MAIEGAALVRRRDSGFMGRWRLGLLLAIMTPSSRMARTGDRRWRRPRRQFRDEPGLLSRCVRLSGRGWIIAKVIQGVLVRLLEAVKADSLAERVQLADMLSRGGIQRTFSRLLGAIAYWLVMLVVLVAALNALQLTATAQLLQGFVGFLPTVVTAIVVLIVGILAAGFLAATSAPLPATPASLGRRCWGSSSST